MCGFIKYLLLETLMLPHKKIGYGNKDAMLDSRLEVFQVCFREIRPPKYTQEGRFMLAFLICGAILMHNFIIHLESVNSII